MAILVLVVPLVFVVVTLYILYLVMVVVLVVVDADFFPAWMVVLVVVDAVFFLLHSIFVVCSCPSSVSADCNIPPVRLQADSWRWNMDLHPLRTESSALMIKKAEKSGFISKKNSFIKK